MDIETLFKDSATKLIDILINETDMGCILVSVSFADLCLKLLLEDKFIKGNTTKEILKSEGLLGDYMSKVKLCYCLRIIKKEEFKDLYTIAEIRNLFAHSHEMLSFDNIQIIKKCENLKSWKRSYNKEFFDPSKILENDIARNKFVYTIHNIITDFMSQIMKNLIYY